MVTQPKQDETWRTKQGYLVRILSSTRYVIDTEYVNGRVNGSPGESFDAGTGRAIVGDDELVECEA